MQKIKIRLPATITGFGTGFRVLGLAVGLYATVELSLRDDTQFKVDLVGRAASAEDQLKHPAVLAMGRFFQNIERASPGVDVRIDSQIPLKSGLGAEGAFAIAGVLGANNLLGSVMKRDEMLSFTASFQSADHVVSALVGGLTAVRSQKMLTYRNFQLERFQIVVIYPKLDQFSPDPLPEHISRTEAQQALQTLPILLENLKNGDVKSLAKTLESNPASKRITDHITGYDHVLEIARQHGALALIPCGDGPSLFALTMARYENLAEEIRLAFQSAGVEAQTWVLPVDTQGVVISAVQSS